MYHKQSFNVCNPNCSKICWKFSEVQWSVIVCRCALPEEHGAAWSHYSEEQQPVWHLCAYMYEETPPLLFFCRCCQLHCVTMATAPNDSWQSWTFLPSTGSLICAKSSMLINQTEHVLKKKMKCSTHDRLSITVVTKWCLQRLKWYYLLTHGS